MRTITITLYFFREMSPHAQLVAYKNYRDSALAVGIKKPLSKAAYARQCGLGVEFTECGTVY